MNLVVYKNQEEVLVCSLEDECCLLKEWFAPDLGRDLTDYDRSQSRESVVRIAMRMVVDC